LLYIKKVIVTAWTSKWTCQKSRRVCCCDVAVFQAKWYIFLQLVSPNTRF